MPGWAAVVGPDGVEQLASYVLALSHGQAESASRGRRAVRCSSSTVRPATALPAPAIRCWARRHSMTQPGTTAASAPTCLRSIANGRNGVMPAFGARLDETQIRLLAAWLKAGAPTNPRSGSGFPPAPPPGRSSSRSRRCGRRLRRCPTGRRMKCSCRQTSRSRAPSRRIAAFLPSGTSRPKAIEPENRVTSSAPARTTKIASRRGPPRNSAARAPSRRKAACRRSAGIRRRRRAFSTPSFDAGRLA